MKTKKVPDIPVIHKLPLVLTLLVQVTITPNNTFLFSSSQWSPSGLSPMGVKADYVTYGCSLAEV